MPASVIVMNRTMVVNEGDNVTLHCISSGFPRPNVSWVNASNYIVETGSILKLTNIGRHIRGFNCSASNACGNESRKVDIDVQCESMLKNKMISRITCCKLLVIHNPFLLLQINLKMFL